ncbi:hypothetical protein ES705_33070 [subsurface metagenome]
MTKKRRKMKEAGKPRHDEFDIYMRAQEWVSYLIYRSY